MPELYEYQRQGVSWMLSNPRTLLGDEPGLGKTAQLIRAAQETEGPICVVAPAMVLDGGTWTEEIGKWAADPTRFVQVPYSRLNEMSGRTMSPNLAADLRQDWGAVILDEAHYVKNPNAKRTKAIQQLSKRTESIRLATGTPIPNWAHELFVPLRLLNPKEARPGGRFGSYWRWAAKWFEIAPTPYSNGKPVVGEMLGCMTDGCLTQSPDNPCRHYRRFFEENLGGLFLQRLRDEVLTDLPPLTTQQIFTPMLPAQRRAYQQMKREYLAEMGDGSDLIAWSASARHVLLDRLSSFDWTTLQGGKLEQLRYDLSNRTRPTLVLAHYRSTVQECAAVAASLGLTVGMVHGGMTRSARQQAVADFKSGRSMVLVGSLETISEGLTLTVADTAILVEVSYKPSRNQQAIRRIHRLGQTRPCTVLEYLTPNSVDAGKRRLLAQKTDHQMRVLSCAQLAAVI